MKLFHNTNIVGLMNLWGEFKSDSRICFSSGDSSKLLGQGWRNITIVIDIDLNNFEHLVSDNDIDAHDTTEWDEIRVLFDSRDDFFNAIEEVIIASSTFKSIRKEIAESGVSGYIMEHLGCYNEDAEDKMARQIKNRSFLGLNIVTSASVKKKYSKYFLNHN